jgi:hypothetical protein
MDSKHHVIDQRFPVEAELILSYQCSGPGIVDMGGARGYGLLIP